MATVAALLGIEESRILWAVWGTTQLHVDGYRSVRSGEWLVTFRRSSSDNPWTSLVNHPCLCLIAPISQHIMLPQSTVATALIFNWVVHDYGSPNARFACYRCEYMLISFARLHVMGLGQWYSYNSYCKPWISDYGTFCSRLRFAVLFSFLLSYFAVCIWCWRFHNLPSFCNCSCKIRPCTWTEAPISNRDPHICRDDHVFTTANSTK